jgi:hypothetical protein
MMIARGLAVFIGFFVLLLLDLLSCDHGAIICCDVMLMIHFNCQMGKINSFLLFSCSLIFAVVDPASYLLCSALAAAFCAIPKSQHCPVGMNKPEKK